MDILKQSIAPLTQAAWNEINEQASRILKSRLTARKFVDVQGPHGWDYGAVNLGRIDIPKQDKENGIQFGTRRVQPLVEVRVPFTMDIWELDNAVRGSEDVDISSMEKAAREIAAFEDKAMYYGFEQGQIKGLKQKSDYKSMECPRDAEAVLQCVPEGVSKFKQASIEGPYFLIVNPKDWREITSYVKGYPMKRQIEDNLEAEIIFCPNIDNMFLVTGRGEDYKLDLGVDISIGYESHDKNEVQLFFTESFTFRVLEPAAVVIFE